MGRLRESVQMLEEARLLAPREDYATLARIHNALGVALGRLGELARAQTELEEAVRCHLLAGSPPGELATAHHNLGTVLVERAHPEAEAHYQTARRLYPPGEYSRMRLMTANNLGVLCYRRGESVRALELLEPARDDAAREGDTFAYCTLMASLGDVHRDQGALDLATADYREALASARKIRYAFLIIYALTALAELDCRHGHLVAAENEIAQAAARARGEHSQTDELAVNLATGILRRAQGNWEHSSLEFHAAIEIARGIGAKRDLARALLEEAVNDLRRDDRVLFRERMEEVARPAQELGETQMLVCSAHWTRTAIETAIQNGIASEFCQAVERQMSALRSCTPLRVEVIAPPRLTVQAFGDGTVWVAGESKPVHWETRLARKLFFLVLSEPTGMPKEKILDMLWPGLCAAEVNKNFYPTVSRVRRVIPREYFFRDSGSRFRVPREGLSYDVEEFERNVAESEDPPGSLQRPRPKSCAPLLRSTAASTWRIRMRIGFCCGGRGWRCSISPRCIGWRDWKKGWGMTKRSPATNDCGRWTNSTRRRCAGSCGCTARAETGTAPWKRIANWRDGCRSNWVLCRIRRRPRSIVGSRVRWKFPARSSAGESVRIDD
jgi:tetratricopeptide (TPR) repeat protein